MIDYYAPIIPYVGMAGILLYSKEEEVNKIVSLDNAEKRYWMINGFDMI